MSEDITPAPAESAANLPAAPAGPKKVLVVGAGGFVGGFLCDEALARGYRVWAGVRKSTSREFLSDLRLDFALFDYDRPEKIAAELSRLMPEGRWDYIVYNLGATKVNKYADFNRINYECLRNFLAALKSTGLMPEKFLYISSLSALGPYAEAKPHADATEEMIPHPNTRYGASKLKAELLLQMDDIPYIILRPTGIYGPREKDYYLMLKEISKGFDFSVGFRRQDLTFIYVEDLARAVFDALEKAPVKEVYNLSEPRSYSQKEFRKIAMEEIGRKNVLPLRMPLWTVKAVSWIAEKWGVLRMKPSTLNSDKYRIMKQRNWKVDISKARRDFGFDPRTDLREGLRKAIRWYRNAAWL